MLNDKVGEYGCGVVMDEIFRILSRNDKCERIRIFYMTTFREWIHMWDAMMAENIVDSNTLVRGTLEWGQVRVACVKYA